MRRSTFENQYSAESELRPLGAWGYLGYSILFSLPLIGWIAVIVFSLVPTNISRRSFARYWLLGLLITAILFAVFYTIVFLILSDAQRAAIFTAVTDALKPLDDLLQNYMKIESVEIITPAAV